jgi:hypothetical protein
MTANTSGMARLFPSKTLSIYDTLVIVTSTLSGLRLRALPNTPLAQLTVKVTTVERKTRSAQVFVQFACICPYWRTRPQNLLVLALF